MDTSGLESFAQNLRTDLLDGVRQRLRYWGFKGDGTVEAEPEEVEGGYTFRGEVHDDPEVPKKWRALKNAVNRHGIDHVAEEAAYTWFNRLVAIRILEKNGHLTEMLEHAGDTRRPAVLDRAYDGIINVLGEEESEEVRQAILESDDDRAFRQLLVGVCHDNDLLNDVFGRLRDYTELLLPMGLLDREGPVDRLVTTDAISDEDYEQVELIGWLYQFYISEKKDEVESKDTLQPEDLPAATQLFTHRWIVQYMVENTIGRQWLDKYPDSDLRDEMEYLVEPENSERQKPIFDDLSELQLFDPAAGSGHILVVGFDLLMKMYRERGYTDRDAVEQILTENLKGLEIDRRAAQLARFALLMKAAQYDRRVLDRDDLRPEVYAMPEPRDFSTSDLRAYLGDDVFDAHGAEVKETLDLIAEHGQNVGSALKLDLSSDARDGVAECVARWDEKTRNGIQGFGEQELHDELRGYLKPLLLLTQEYLAVSMNPPYRSSGKLNEPLKEYLGAHYPESESGLSAVFMEVGEKNTQATGRLGMINQQSWMFLSSYDDLRDYMLDATYIESMLHLGPDAFDEISGEVVQATTFVLQNMLPEGREGTYFRLVEEENSIAKKEAFEAGCHRYTAVDQQDFEKIPDSPIAYWASSTALDSFEEANSLGEVAKTRVGLDTGNNDRFLREWYEIDNTKFTTNAECKEDVFKGDFKYVPHVKGGSFRKWFGNLSNVIKFDEKNYRILSKSGNKLPSKQHYFKKGWSWSRIGTGKFSVRATPRGCVFNSASPTGFSDVDDVVISLLNSKISEFFIRIINPTINFHSGTIDEIPVYSSDTDGKKRYLSRECQSIAKEDWVRGEAFWGFKKHFLVEEEELSLKSAYNSWTEKVTGDFLRLHSNEEEINDLFIDLYGLEDELSPRVALDDITILEDELDRDALEELDDERGDLSDEELRQRFLEDDPDDALFKVEVPIRQFLSYGIGVMLGRYRLGHDGLHIAHPNPSSDELAPYDLPVPLSGPQTNGTEQFEIDDDAIVPLMGRDSPFSDDAVHRMRDIVRLIWGEETLTENLNFIDRALSIGRGRGYKRNYEQTMEDWLVGVESHRTKIRNFWDWHKDLYGVRQYGKKPIYWLFQSPEEHFQVLVYMHRMDKFTPQRIRQDYLQRYQQYLRREISELEQEGEETLSKEKADRLDTLRAAAEDCRAYDTILQEVAEQQIEIDLDDGVQNNYPKFGDAVAEL
ncbi:BREX-1 system adenine-specific DNA-methyltransferase PglX [Salinibacter ruber]|uniref:BREX-1 system adenine-specific DNA-methyltransferase PglX n=1 Tax=Salinibacter ruber TaxID=146919 RepID=UPI002167C993|nr:BREX-1 system adenine-specific DNA-methyltransferase PglX [Salinibacter ruber]MCS3698392.1 hypothetical protein [Salinibacter ruber]